MLIFKTNLKLFTISPVPSYNWTRKGAPLPKGSHLTSYNRVLIIPHVQVEDQGEYNCHVFNDRDSKEKSLTLTIQGNYKLLLLLCLLFNYKFLM